VYWAKQSTAASYVVGPILDPSGAEYASAVIGDLSLSKNGGTLTALASTATLTYIANGQYTLSLNTTNTNTLGAAQVTCNKAGYQMPTLPLMVLPATVYDALVTNAVNSTGGLAGATGAITALAGAVSTLTGAQAATAVWQDTTAGDFTAANSVGKSVMNGVALGTGLTIARCTLTDTLTTYTGNTPQTGDAYARIGAPAGASVSADILTTNTRLTSARAGYLDNLNVGGAVASHADVLAINTSSSKHVVLTTVGQYERPESGSTVYTVEARTFSAGDGSAVNADTTPTLTATGQTSGSLAANLSAATNPATGVYRWTYTVSSSATTEPVRFDVSAVISSATFTLSAYTQVVDLVSATWTTTDASHLTALFNCVNGTTVNSAVVALSTAALRQFVQDNTLGTVGTGSVADKIRAAVTDVALDGTRLNQFLDDYTTDGVLACSLSGTVQQVEGDVKGKVLGDSGATLVGPGVIAVDGNGDALATANMITGLNDLNTAQVTAAVNQSSVLLSVPAATAAAVTSDHGSGSYARNTEPPAASAVASAVLAAGDVDGFTLEQTLKLCLAALAGKLDGALTTTVTIRAADDSKDRITATVDAGGNRTAVTYDAAG
jgi:hypothetical protein